MTERSRPYFPIFVLGSDVRAVVGAVDDIPAHCTVTMCSDGWLFIEEPNERVRVSVIQLTQEQVELVRNSADESERRRPSFMPPDLEKAPPR